MYRASLSAILADYPPGISFMYVWIEMYLTEFAVAKQTLILPHMNKRELLKVINNLFSLSDVHTSY